MTKYLRKVHRFLLFFGFDGLTFLKNLSSLPYFLMSFLKFKKLFKGKERISFNLQLLDRDKSAGAVKSHYFWQDLVVARKINESNVKNHADIGSRIDGFIAHLLSFGLNLTIFDIRPLPFEFEGLKFKRLNLMENIKTSADGQFESLSCLHTIEHFGLGRYNDPIDPEGHFKGLSQITKLIKPKGVFYLSFPIGKNKIEFNAHRVIEPKAFFEEHLSSLFQLSQFIIIDESCEIISLLSQEFTLYDFNKHEYSCGIFILKKNYEANS